MTEGPDNNVGERKFNQEQQADVVSLKQIIDDTKTKDNFPVGKNTLTLFRMHLDMVAYGWGVKKASSSVNFVTHILQPWNLEQLPKEDRRSKKYINYVIHPLSSAYISIFSLEIRKFCYIKKYSYRLHFNA